MQHSKSLQQWRNSGDWLTFERREIFYRTGGPRDAPVLILIHGFPTASWDWQRLWPTLVDRYRLFAPDLLGFGFSAKPYPHAYSIPEQADLIEALMRANDVATAHVVAHDYGDTVAQELLARHNAGGALRLQSLTLLNGGLFPETHHPRMIQRLLLTPAGALIAQFTGRRQFGKSFSALFGADTQPSAEELDDFWFLIDHDSGHRIMHRLQRYMLERRAHRSRWVGALQQTNVPLKLINGSVDPVSGAHVVARWRDVVPQHDITELPTIGHYPQVEAPEAVAQAVIAFLSRHSSTSA